MEFLEVLWRIHIEGNVRIVHRHVEDAGLVGMLDVAGGACSGSAKKNFNHLPANHEWMSVLAGEFGNHGPDLVVGLQEFIFELLNGLLAGSGTIGQCDDGGIASAIEHFVQSR